MREYGQSREAWLPPHPLDWAETPLWTLFTRDSRKGHSGERLLSVYRDHGVVPRDSRNDNHNMASEDLSGYQLVEPGDLVINKMKAWQGSMSVSDLRGIVSPAYFVFRPHHNSDQRYLHYLLRSQPLIAAYIGLSKGIRPNQWDLDPWAFSRLVVPLPPLAEQRSIAKFLDRELAKIDELITEQQRLIDLLRERRAAVVDHLFSARPSVVATRLSHLLVARPIYGVLVPEYVDEGGIPFVRVGDLLGLDPAVPLRQIATEQAAQYSRTSLVGGEVLLGVVGKMGQATVAPRWLAGANVNRAVAVLRTAQDRDARLLCAWLGSSAFLRQAELSTSGDSVQATLGMGDLAQFTVNWPIGPDAAVELDERTRSIDALIVEGERFIGLSQERRSALITAAVTGQIDVRAA